MSEILDKPITMELPMDVPESLYQLVDILKQAGYEAFIVGGAVRDTLLGRRPKDYDISTSARPEEALRLLEPHVKFAGVQGEKSFAVARVVAFDGNEYEFAPYRSDEGTRKGGFASPVSSIKEDVSRRDLTINALFYELPSRDEREFGQSGRVIDYVGGIEDINNEVIRTVGNPEKRFSEDRLRILRAFRFAGRVDGKLDKESEEAIMSNNSLTSPSDAAVSEERIKEELIKGVKSAKIPANYLNMLLDFGLFEQIIPGLSLSRAFSSSRNISVQLALMLKGNDSTRAAKVLASRKFGNDIKSAVKILLDLDNISRENIVSLKKEYLRIKASSNESLDDESLQEYGAAIGKDFSKFLSFANAPPSVSAKDLIAGGMKPGPEIGRAIHEAEVKAYFEENIGDPISMTEAGYDVAKKLVKLAILLERLNAKEEVFGLNNIITKFAGTDYFIPKLSGHVYIFDMDDTLFWSPEWSDIVEDENGKAVGINNDRVPNVIGSAINLVESINSSPHSFIRKDKDEEERLQLAEDFKINLGSVHLRRRRIDIPWLGKSDQVIYVLEDAEGSDVKPDELKKYFSSKTLKLLDLRGKYLQDSVVIAGDPVFYASPETLGIIPNEEVVNVYLNNFENSLILTARESGPGMEEGIAERLESIGAPQPIHIYTKPKGESSGKYKGEVIGKIASLDSVEKITFFDDNKNYIESVEKVLEEKFSEHKEKVTIVKVDTKSKPEKGRLKGEL